MLAHTKPMFCAPIVLDSDNGAHIRITYTDTSTESVTLGASGGTTYYPLFDGSSDDLFFAIRAALDAATGDTWKVNQLTDDWWGRMEIVQTVGAKTPSQIQFLTDELTGEMLGYTSNTVAFVSGNATAVYRAAHMWTPDDTATMNDPRDDVLVTSTKLATGFGVDELWGSRILRTVMIPLLPAPYVKTEYAADSDHADEVENLTVGDPNASLQAWLGRVRSALPGPTPRILFCIDRQNPSSTKQPCYFSDDRYLRSVREWTGEAVSNDPLLYTVTVELLETT